MKKGFFVFWAMLLSLGTAVSTFGAAAPEAELPDILSPAEIASELLDNKEAFSASSLLVSEQDGQSDVRLFVLVDKSEQRLWVYEDSVLTGSWLVSTGTEALKCAPSRCYVAGTPTGTFKPYRMEYVYTSRLWNARMDRAIFVIGGIALHATYGENIANLGRRASGGCVRQAPMNAHKLYGLVSDYGMGATRVKIRE